MGYNMMLLLLLLVVLLLLGPQPIATTAAKDVPNPHHPSAHPFHPSAHICASSPLSFSHPLRRVTWMSGRLDV